MRARARCHSPRRPPRPPAPTRATSSSPSSPRTRGAGIALALLLTVLAAPGAAHAAADGDLPAVTVSPPDRAAPNGGQWFTVVGRPGERVGVEAQLFNLAKVPQSVSLYLSALEIVDGRPQVGDRGVGVGAWGTFDEPRVLVQPRQFRRATFAVTVPTDAEPGDHLAAVVAESQPTTSQSGVNVVKRVAARLYVTVPGDAKPALEIESVSTRLDSTILPRHIDVAIVVRNTGNVRLHVRTTVNGRRAIGPRLVVSASAERYDLRVPVSIWGGRKQIRVEVSSRTEASSGPSAVATRHVWALPWWVLVAASLAVIGFFALRELRRRLR